jgi:ribose transport system substrate-binding protein
MGSWLGRRALHVGLYASVSMRRYDARGAGPSREAYFWFFLKGMHVMKMMNGSKTGRWLLSSIAAGVMLMGAGCEQKTPAPAKTTPAPAKAESKPAESKPVEAKPTEAKPTEAKPTEAKPTEAKPTEAKPTEAKPVEGAAPKAATKKTYTFGVIAKSQGNPVFQAARTGAVEAGKDLTKDGIEVKIDWRTPNNEDAQMQAQYIEQLVTAGVDGIAVSVTDAKVLTSAINSAVDKGVPVVCFDSDAPESKRFAMYGMDDFAAGQVLGGEIAKALGGKGVVAILAGNQNATNLQNRVRGVKDALSKVPSITIKDTYYHAETAPEAVAKVKQVQGSNPEITGWAMVGGWPLFTEKALDGIADKGVKVVSVDTLPQQLTYVRNGQVQALVGQNCYGWGFESVKLLFDKVHNGKTPATPVQKASIDIVTKDNVDQFAGLWDKWLGKTSGGK